MTTIQIVNSIIVLLLPFLIALCYVLAQLLIQRLPTAQRQALEQFARMAVKHVEQEHPSAADKKELALAYATDMFRLHNLPVPLPDVLVVAVGAAQYETQKHG